MPVEYIPIGVIHSPFPEPKGVPIQPTAAKGINGSIEVFPEFVDGLKDLDGFSHIVLIYHLHSSSGFKLHVIPFLDTEERGVFSTRAPHRPNPIGLSIVKLLSLEGNILTIEGMDMIDGSPLLDIKPYLPTLNPGEDIRAGWAEQTSQGFQWKRADSRFEDQKRKNHPEA